MFWAWNRAFWHILSLNVVKIDVKLLFFFQIFGDKSQWGISDRKREQVSDALK